MSNKKMANSDTLIQDSSCVCYNPPDFSCYKTTVNPYI